VPEDTGRRKELVYSVMLKAWEKRKGKDEKINDLPKVASRAFWQCDDDS